MLHERCTKRANEEFPTLEPYAVLPAVKLLYMGHFNIHLFSSSNTHCIYLSCETCLKTYVQWYEITCIALHTLTYLTFCYGVSTSSH